jgi:protein-S-isoprenylcysteine O-methyltransferase Ste14
MSPWSAPLQVSVICWFALELGLVIRDVVRRKTRLGRDRGTRLLVSLSIGASIVLGLFMRIRVDALDTPAPKAFAIAGLIVIWLGLGVRIWAVLALGHSFSTFVQVEAAQPVVTRGPYRWVRHPSYSGLLLICLGFGISFGNWLSVLTCAVGPLLGLLPRITVEETELVRVLGEQYRGYQKTTYRLVPRVW